MRLSDVRLPDGREPTWRDALVLNIGVGVLPEFQVEAVDEWTVPNDVPFAPVVHMTVQFLQSEGRFAASFVGLQARDVTGTDLREVRVGELLRLASSAGIFVQRDKDDPPASIRDWWGEEEVSFVGSEMGEMIRKAGPVEWVLKELALVYSVAQISSQAPVKAVQKAFGLTARTAARWIAKAREAGLMVRPAVPGMEHITEGMDEIRDKIARGDFGGLVTGTYNGQVVGNGEPEATS